MFKLSFVEIILCLCIGDNDSRCIRSAYHKHRE
nr:MAG TPA_asm: hypothetical protein [Caudoviricetes sp.]